MLDSHFPTMDRPTLTGLRRRRTPSWNALRPHFQNCENFSNICTSCWQREIFTRYTTETCCITAASLNRDSSFKAVDIYRQNYKRQKSLSVWTVM